MTCRAAANTMVLANPHVASLGHPLAVQFFSACERASSQPQGRNLVLTIALLQALDALVPLLLLLPVSW